jgi:hypothetical protein
MLLETYQENNMAQAQTAPVAKRARKSAVIPAPAGFKIDKVDKKAEKKADERFLGISTATLVTAIENANGFGKSALHLELAVGLALFSNIGKADINAKKSLYEIYRQAGFQCKKATDADYKTVSRRINVVSHLYKWLGEKAAVDEWTVATTEMQTIQVIVTNIEEYGFKGMNDVLARVGKPVAKAPVKHHAKPVAKPVEAPVAPTTEDLAVMEAVGSDIDAGRTEGAVKRRSSDGENSVQVIKTAHLHVALPYNIDKAEVMELAMALLAYASGDKSVAVEPRVAVTG